MREAWTAEAVHNVSVPAARRAAAGDADELFAHARPPTKPLGQPRQRQPLELLSSRLAAALFLLLPRLRRLLLLLGARRVGLADPSEVLLWTTGAGRITGGGGGRGRRQAQLLSVDLVLVAEPVGSVAAAHSVVRVASQTCRRRIRRRRGRCQPARAAGWSGPGSPDEGTLGLVGGPVPCSRSRQSKGWGYGPDRPRLALLYPQAGLC